MADPSHDPTTTLALLAAIEQMEEGVIIADVNGAVVGIAINGVVGSTGTSLLHDLRSEKQ